MRRHGTPTSAPVPPKATLLGEIGDCRSRYLTADGLAADAGQAAVAIEPGKGKIGAFRWRCDHRLRFAFARLSDGTRHTALAPWARRPLQPRTRPHARDPHRRLRLEPRPLALLARPHTLRSHPRRPPPTPHRRPIPTPSGRSPTSPLPSRWPAPPSPTWRGPQSRARSA